MKSRIFLLSFLLTISLLTAASIPKTYALNGADVAIYKGSGTWQDSIIAFKKFLEWKGLTYEEVNSWDINNRDLRTLYKALFMPGGWAYNYKKFIKSSGNQNIRNLVNSGGAYIGVSAGAYYACDNVKWQGTNYPYYLNLFHGDCIGPIDEIAPWPEYVMTTIKINKTHQANIYEPASENVLYYGEPYFVAYSGQEMQVLARWTVPNSLLDNTAGIIGFNYGSGRVLLLGPHLEIEEDSDRDGTNFADEFDDKGSDWPFLWTAVDWVLKRNISEPREMPYSRDEITPVIHYFSDLPDPISAGQLLKIEANVTDNVALELVWVNILGIDYPMNLDIGAETEVFFDGFESGNLNEWITTAVSGANKWISSNVNPYQGSWHAYSQPMSTNEPASILERTISTSGYQNIKLSYYRRLVGLDIADEFKAKWYDGTSWNLLEQTGSSSANDASYVYKEYFLPSNAANNPNFKIRFECTAGAVSEYCRVDNVKINANTFGTGLYEYFYDTTGLIGEYDYLIYAQDTSGNQAYPSLGSFNVT